MAENPISGTGSATVAATRRSAEPVISARSGLFKYYIHDGVECLRLQLIGELSDLDVAELSGCWNTARTTLGNRKLILDLTSLRKSDEAGHEWLLSMVREGATSLPESYFRDRLAGLSHAAASGSSRTIGKLGRVAGFFRGSRDIDVGSSTTRAR